MLNPITLESPFLLPWSEFWIILQANQLLLSIGTIVFLLLFTMNVPNLVPTSHAQATPAFSNAVNLSNDAGTARCSLVSSNGQNVYVPWSEGSRGIFFRVSTNGGVSWIPLRTSPVPRLSVAGGVSQFLVMFTQFQNAPNWHIYTSWAQTTSGVLQIFVTVSVNNGRIFTTTQESTQGRITPSVAA